MKEQVQERISGFLHVVRRRVPGARRSQRKGHKLGVATAEENCTPLRQEWRGERASCSRNLWEVGCTS